MKAGIIFFAAALLLFISCNNNWLNKPEGLLSEKKMVDMLVDLHLANAIFENQGGGSEDKKLVLTSEDYYYSVLKKYNVPDSTFEKSFVYYASFPKTFEKIYASVLDKATQVQEQYKGKLPEPVETKQ
jgi:hypothetical protein